MSASSPAATGKRYIRMLVRTRNAWAWWPGRSSKPVYGQRTSVAVRFPRIPLLGSRSVPELFAGKLTAVLLTGANRRVRKMTNFSHLDEEGAARMVDVGGKAMIQRTATATGRISMSRETVELLREKALPKGDALNTASITGVMAAKRTPDLIPLCHGLNLTSVDLDFEVGDEEIDIVATARASDRTGVEMEALTAVSVAALTLYDMCKAVDKGMVVGEIKLLDKTKQEVAS